MQGLSQLLADLLWLVLIALCLPLVVLLLGLPVVLLARLLFEIVQRF